MQLATGAGMSFGEGFWPAEETDNGETFRWMSRRGVFSFPPAEVPQFLELRLSCEFADTSQNLTTTTGEQFALAPGLSNLSIRIPPNSSTIEIVADRVTPLASHPADSRELAICVRSATIHQSEQRHLVISRQHQNGVLNIQEMMAGVTQLRSTPPVLGIDLYGACNVKPPCVYCEWDWNKKLEGDFVDVPFDENTLRDLGVVYDNAATLVNCSIGEPFMMKNIDELLDEFADSGKTLDMTSNGQILTDRNIQRLLGRDIDLYVSLDAATPETYAKLRNNRFPQLVANLKRLVAAKGGPGRLPRLNLVFMPMKANHHELDQFVALTAEIGADRLVLRPLNYAERLELTWKREGYEFDYQKELLPFEQLIWISGRARALCDQAGIALSDQLDFGGSFEAQFRSQYQAGLMSLNPPAQEHEIEVKVEIAAPEPAPAVADAPSEPVATANQALPLCTEPWKSMYVLRRGVFPCCYGGQPLAPMNEAASMWNSKAVEKIRADLQRGRFPSYCLDSPACPIVRKHEQARELSKIDALRLNARHGLNDLHRGMIKTINTTSWVSQWSRIRLKRILTEPAYVRLHVTKAFKKITGRPSPK